MSTLSVTLCIVGIPVSFFCAYHMFQNYHWVEFDGKKVRGLKFWSRRYVEHDIETLLDIRVLGNRYTKNGGYELVFRQKPSIALVRFDMTRIDDFLDSIKDELSNQTLQPTGGQTGPASG